jgi:hypothetical protein
MGQVPSIHESEGALRVRSVCPRHDEPEGSPGNAEGGQTSILRLGKGVPAGCAGVLGVLGARKSGSARTGD